MYLVVRLMGFIRSFFPFLLLAWLLWITGCTRPQKEYLSFVEFPSASMQKNVWTEITPFSDSSLPVISQSDSAVSAVDSIQKMSSKIIVRYDASFPYEYLVLNIEELMAKSDTLSIGTVKIPLFSSGGKPLSKNRHGIFETSFPLHEAFSPDKEYIFSFSTPMDSVTGLHAVGLVVSPLESN